MKRSLEQARAALGAGADEGALRLASAAREVARRAFLTGLEGSWIDDVRRRQRDMLAAALLVMGEAALHRDPAAAVTHARELIALDAVSEDGYRLLMRAHVAAGNRAEALIAYMACRAALVEEVGVEPSRETQQTYLKVLRSSESEEDLRRSQTRFVDAGGARVAYQTAGAGDVDVVFVAGSFIHVDTIWHDAAPAAFFSRFLPDARLVFFDPAGTGPAAADDDDSARGRPRAPPAAGDRRAAGAAADRRADPRAAPPRAPGLPPRAGPLPGGEHSRRGAARARGGRGVVRGGLGGDRRRHPRVRSPRRPRPRSRASLWFDDQDIARRASSELSAREPAQSPSRIGDQNVRGAPAMDDDEVPAAEPATEMRDRGQRALPHRVVRHVDPSGSEAEPLGGSREGQEVRPGVVERDLSLESFVVERIPTMGGHHGERCRSAIVAAALADDRQLSRRAATGSAPRVDGGD